MRTYIFTFYSHPRYWRAQSIAKRFANAAQAQQFADGLQRGGAWDVRFTAQSTPAQEKE